MSSRVKVVYEGKTVDAEEMGFDVAVEVSGSYKVSDGAVIDLKHKVVSIYKLCDQAKEDGTPIYLVTGSAALVTELPKKAEDLVKS